MHPIRLAALCVATATTIGLFVNALALRYPCCGTEPDVYSRRDGIPKPTVLWMSREAICCARKGRDKRCSYEYC